MAKEKKYSTSLYILKKLEELLIKYDYKQTTQLLILTHSNLAFVHKELKNFDLALNYLKKAVTLCENNNEIEDTITTYLNICAIFSQLGKHKKALDHAIKAAFKCQENFPHENPTVKQVTLLANAFYNMGIEEEYLGCVVAAKEWYKKAYEVLERNNKVDPEMKVEFYKKLQEVTENTNVVRFKRKKKIGHCSSQRNLVPESLRAKVVKLKPKTVISPFVVQPRFIERIIKRNTSRKIITPLTSTFRDKNTSRVIKASVNNSKLSKDILSLESNKKKGKESTTDYHSDTENEPMLMTILNKINKEPPLDPLLDKIPHKESEDESKEEKEMLREFEVLEWSDLEELCNREVDNNVVDIKVKGSTNKSNTSNKLDSNVKSLNKEKLFEGNMYFDNNNYLVKYFIDEGKDLIIKLKNIATRETQLLHFTKEQASNVLKKNSENMITDSINALAQLLTLKKSKGNNNKVHKERIILLKGNMIKKIDKQSKGVIQSEQERYTFNKELTCA